MDYIVDLSTVNAQHVHLVGGKNASLGEMIQHLTAKGIAVPGGFATTAAAFKQFLAQKNLDKTIYHLLKKLNTNHIPSLNKTSAAIRKLIINTPFSREFEQAVAKAYLTLNHKTVAVRSSATAEDLANASFAGQQETYLNISGLKQVLLAIKHVYASLFTSRAINYRVTQGFDHQKVAISVGIQPMIRSDKGASGVLFTLDTESGFDKVMLINASYGLGEAIVQGKVNPDEYVVFKPSLEQNKNAILQKKCGTKAVKMIYGVANQLKSTIKIVKVAPKDQVRFCLSDADIQTLAKQALIIEKHYGKPMDIEWAKDGITGKIYIVQARPETVNSQCSHTNEIVHYTLQEKGKLLTQGQSIGQQIGQGYARLISQPENAHLFKKGDVLVTDMTDPDWEPIMKRASAIITNRGGRTCHAAIIARELGIPAIIGCGNATKTIKANQPITASCAEGQTGYVYAGKLPYTVNRVSIANLPELPFKLCLNIGNPDKAFALQSLPNQGVGLARIEFIISNAIGIHPTACLQYKTLPAKLRKAILEKTASYKNPVEFYIETLRAGIATLAAAFYPKQIIFRFSDFKSNEYANLLGGHLYEPHEENPMIGFRGASRYAAPSFMHAFELECITFKRVRDEMGLTNAQIMIPFVRTVAELKQIIALMNKFGLKRGENGLKVLMMCEIPSNALLAHEFLEHVDGFSIGSNDLTQLTLGLDRDSSLVAPLFDERNDAVKLLLKNAITACKKENKYIGICGQAPSDYPEFAEWLAGQGVGHISLNPDVIVETWLTLGKKFAAKVKTTISAH